MSAVEEHKNELSQLSAVERQIVDYVDYMIKFGVLVMQTPISADPSQLQRFARCLLKTLRRGVQQVSALDVANPPRSGLGMYVE